MKQVFIGKFWLNNDIESFIHDDYSPLVFSFQGANLLVFENKLSKALKALEDFQKESVELEVEYTIDSSSSLLCPKCGSNHTYNSGGEYSCYYCSNKWIPEGDPNYTTGGSI